MFSFCHVLKELHFDHSALQQSSLMIVSWPEGEHNWPKTVFYCKCTWQWQVLHFYLLFKRYELTRLDPAPGASGTAGCARRPGTASRRHVASGWNGGMCAEAAHSVTVLWSLVV